MKLDRKAVKILNFRSVNDDEFIKADSASLFEMVWEITRDLWSFTGESDAERRLQRNAVNIIRIKESTGREKDILDVKMLKKQNK